ncbi:MAG TPA: DUF4252 domain-containing protein [Blastocatellia bacterium]|nr:DUF4252 domain-containing protein [Blastocatellia bacterium]
MRSIITNMVRLAGLCLLVSVSGAMTAHAQDARLDLSPLERFSDKADKVIEVDVGEALIKLALSALKPERNPDEAKIKELLEGLKGVYVKRYQFASFGEFNNSDMDPIRAQLRNPAWSRIANVRSKREGNYDVYIMTEGSIIRGLAVLAAEPKALTVVNVVGPIDISKLSELEGKFGIPRWELMTGPKVDDGGGSDNEKPAEKKPPRPEDPQADDQGKVAVKDVTTVKRAEKKQPPKLIRNSEKPPKEQ